MITNGKPFEYGGAYAGDEMIHIIATPTVETLCDRPVAVPIDSRGLPIDIPSAKPNAGVCTACKDVFTRIVIGAR